MSKASANLLESSVLKRRFNKFANERKESGKNIAVTPLLIETKITTKSVEVPINVTVPTPVSTNKRFQDKESSSPASVDPVLSNIESESNEDKASEQSLEVEVAFNSKDDVVS